MAEHITPKGKRWHINVIGCVKTTWKVQDENGEWKEDVVAMKSALTWQMNDTAFYDNAWSIRFASNRQADTPEPTPQTLEDHIDMLARMKIKDDTKSQLTITFPDNMPDILADGYISDITGESMTIEATGAQVAPS
jgi:hypothetical protein